MYVNENEFSLLCNKKAYARVKYVFIISELMCSQYWLYVLQQTNDFSTTRLSLI